MRPRTSTASDCLPGASDLGAPRRRPDIVQIETEKYFSRSVRRFSAVGGSAPVRAVEVGGFAANFAEPRFIRGEHFNRKGSQTLLWSVWELRKGAQRSSALPRLFARLKLLATGKQLCAGAIHSPRAFQSKGLPRGRRPRGNRGAERSPSAELRSVRRLHKKQVAGCARNLFLVKEKSSGRYAVPSGAEKP